jgi:hypothetical protein
MQLGNRGVWRAQPLLCLSSSSSSSSSRVSLQEESRCCYRRFFCASFWSPKFLSPPPPQKSALRRFGLRKVIVLRRRASSSSSTTKMTSSSRTTQNFQFGDAISISPKHVFYETPLSFAFVNLKPVVPGHVLVCPKRIVEKYEEMTTEEISDAMSVSQKVAVGAFVPFLKASSPPRGEEVSRLDETPRRCRRRWYRVVRVVVVLLFRGTTCNQELTLNNTR